MRQAVIEAATGRILRIVVSPDAQEAGPGEAVIAPVPDHIADDTHYRAGGDWVAYPPRPDGAADFDFATGEWVADPASDLMAERRLLNPFRRAFMQALALTPWIDAPNALAALDAAVAALPPGHPLRIWRENVVQIVRLHPDMDLFGAAFGLSPADLDDLCRLALAIERGEITVPVE